MDHATLLPLMANHPLLSLTVSFVTIIGGVFSVIHIVKTGGSSALSWAAILVLIVLPLLGAVLVTSIKTGEEALKRPEVPEKSSARTLKTIKNADKQSLDALLRIASANATNAWIKLSELEAVPPELYADPPYAQLYRRKQQKAATFVVDYWNAVVRVVEETPEDIFLEVKREVSLWLQAQDPPGSAEIQLKALDLIERHVSEIRSGHSYKPHDLAQSFTQLPEFR